MGTNLNLEAITNSASFAYATTQQPADMPMTNHAKSKNNLSMLQLGTGLGSGTTVDVTVAQKSSTEIANYNKSVKLDAVDKSARVSREDQALLDTKASEVYDVV